MLMCNEFIFCILTLYVATLCYIDPKKDIYIYISFLNMAADPWAGEK